MRCNSPSAGSGRSNRSGGGMPPRPRRRNGHQGAGTVQGRLPADVHIPSAVRSAQSTITRTQHLATRQSKRLRLVRRGHRLRAAGEDIAQYWPPILARTVHQRLRESTAVVALHGDAHHKPGRLRRTEAKSYKFAGRTMPIPSPAATSHNKLCRGEIDEIFQLDRHHSR